MVVRRRQLLKNVLIGAPTALMTSKVKAFPITKILGQTNHKYRAEYYRRYLKWYSKNHFDFFSSFSSIEKKFFEHWLSINPSWGWQASSNTFFENLLTKHRINSGRLQSGYLYLGNDHWDSTSTPIINEMFSHKKISRNENLTFFGFGWNSQNNQMKVFYRSPKNSNTINDSENRTNIPTLHFFEYSAGELVRSCKIKKLDTIPRKALGPLHPLSAHSCFQITDDSAQVYYKLRTRSTFLPSLPEGSKKVASLHRREFHQLPDFLDLNEKRTVKIYFP